MRINSDRAASPTNQTAAISPCGCTWIVVSAAPPRPRSLSNLWARLNPGRHWRRRKFLRLQRRRLRVRPKPFRFLSRELETKFKIKFETKFEAKFETTNATVSRLSCRKNQRLPGRRLRRRGNFTCHRLHGAPLLLRLRSYPRLHLPKHSRREHPYCLTFFHRRR